ncbi:sigma-54-dependent Fis family transcriptional regulator [Erythrobacter sp. WH131]|uniref:Sigma-54-dependent Fis family transcriptional regulator n=1 Tax=Erythrobacter ani TaxID=2827235 RepID=A0ABS6SMG9_9SPHN|nr:sigma-54-dependent Fis family transcriptional regulator [Erythrobacter ani]
MIRHAVATLERFAECDIPILIYGETGTGKELFARTAHYNSERLKEPFIPVNCGALHDSLIESELFGHCRGAFTDAKRDQPGLVALAEKGTLFLDEIDTLSARAQVALLRFLQDQQYRPVGGANVLTADVRVLAATNANLDHLVDQGLFRQDLKFRIDVAAIGVPPLRNRGPDRLLLAEHFLKRFASRYGKRLSGFGSTAKDELYAHNWPGNVRELENAVHRAVILADKGKVERLELGLEHQEPARPNMDMAINIVTKPDFREGMKAARACYLRQFEREYLSWLLRKTHGNVSAAARVAQTERRHLGRVIKRTGLSPDSFRTG